MKRFISSLAACLILLSPASALAASLQSGQQYSLAAQKAISGNLYVAAGTTTIGGRVTGDLIAAGGTITVSGSVGGDIAAAGGTIQVLGPVDGDVRVVGGTITISDRVSGDLVVVGGTAHVLPGAIISGDMVVAGGQIIIDGSVYGGLTYVGGTLLLNGAVRGDVDAKANSSLELGSSAVVGGDFTYRAPREATIADGARVLGSISYEPMNRIAVDEKSPRRVFWAFVGVMTGMRLLALLGLAAVLIWRWRRQTLEVFSSVRESFWQSLGHGLAYGILVPIASLLLLISFIGILPGILLVLTFLAALILTKALVGVFVGSWLVMAMKKKEALHISWGSALVGIILFQAVCLIPVLGWIFSMAFSLAIFGAIGRKIQQLLSR